MLFRAPSNGARGLTHITCVGPAQSQTCCKACSPQHNGRWTGVLQDILPPAPCRLSSPAWGLLGAGGRRGPREGRTGWREGWGPLGKAAQVGQILTAIPEPHRLLGFVPAIDAGPSSPISLAGAYPRKTGNYALACPMVGTRHYLTSIRMQCRPAACSHAGPDCTPQHLQGAF